MQDGNKKDEEEKDSSQEDGDAMHKCKCKSC